MSIPEIDALDTHVAALTRDGASLTAERLLSDTVRMLVRSPYALPAHIKYLAHYTSIDVLFSLLSCPAQPADLFELSSDAPDSERSDGPEFLRLYDTFNANDPNEGRFFVHSTPRSHRFTRQHSNLWALLEDRAQLPAYVSAFRGLSQVSEVDELLFWRTYGKDGKGCAIVFPVSFLAPDTPILQVRYGPDSVKSCLDNLNNVFSALSAARSLRQSGLLYASGEIPTYVSASLSPIPYLHKANDYDFEEEVRVVVPYVDLHPKSLSCHRTHHGASRITLRHFAHLKTLEISNLLRTDSVIYIGPTALKQDNIRFVLERRLANLRLFGAKVVVSKIDYRS